ncbi:hypothetical protein P171DRAFT_417928 [Karstenula rhodostoma CBS 690.94]|uniref:Nucleolar protein 12 n=1 Tax=Karstenula rhodostoma CBS 690.94 TaxID=1392251 RepID=A0A9P4PGM3_9PLEO|nr:hypothetical protein P171DRAFT_417928 [Karstenula rhodostoma CBS 690.94]
MGAPKKSSSALAAADQKAFDPSLASLFASSLGPVKPPPKSRYQELVKQHAGEDSSGDDDDDNDATLSSVSDDIDDSEQDDSDEEAAGSSGDDDGASKNETALARVPESASDGAQERSNKKRKRGAKDDDVEDVYMQKIAREEAKDEEERKKKRKTKTADVDGSGEDDDSDQETFLIPKHETLTGADGNDDDEVEKAARTVFLGNVSNEAITSKSAEKQLKQHLSSFIADLADNKPPHKVESIRFRSTAFAGALPKRAAFAKKEIMDATTKSTNAYVVYSTKTAAREAARRLNGTVILGRHLRVDSIAHPAKVDHRRCVFVGNLGFVDDDSKLPTDDDKPKKKNKPPGDVEEGLWVQFSKAGKVESVRVPRDAKTRVSKGFAYVQFEDENAVEAALQFNDQKYPPLLPRKLRVTRARAQKKKDKKHTGPPPSKADDAKPKGAYNAKISAEEKSQRGRAGAMLNKAAKFKTAESFVFEGHRASSKQGKSGLKLGGKTNKKGPNGRKSRSKAWKATGGKK